MAREKISNTSFALLPFSTSDGSPKGFLRGEVIGKSFTVRGILRPPRRCFNRSAKLVSKSNFFLFLIVVASASLFRLTNLNLIEFKGDEAINLFLASRPLFGHPFPPGGTVSSIGILNPPLLNYLLFPFTLISLDPRIISFFIGLLNSLTIGFFFLLIKRYYQTSTALIASLLFALSPWAILFSRKIWTQNLILPFLILLLYSLHKIILEKKMVFWTIYAFSSLLLVQLHQSILFFLLLINIFLLIKKVKIDFRYLSLGSLLGLLPAIPYLVYIFKNISIDPQVFLVAKGRFSPSYFPIIFFRPLQIMSQGNFHFVLGDDMLTFARQFPLAYQLRRFFYLEYLLLPLGMLIFWKKFPSFRSFVYASLGLPVIYFFLRVEPFIHYFLVLIPFLFLFLANGFSFFSFLKNSFFKNIALIVFLGLIGTSLVFNLAFFRFLDKQKGLKGDYGSAFIISEEKAKEKLQPYQDDKAYPEMLLASYLPRSFFHGNMPVPKMLYSFEETERQLSSLEERLRGVPEDARVQNELLAFYTISPPTRETVNLLEKKNASIPGYKPIYDEVHRLFLEQNP